MVRHHEAAHVARLQIARDFVELALKLLKLQRVLGDDAHIRDGRGM